MTAILDREDYADPSLPTVKPKASYQPTGKARFSPSSGKSDGQKQYAGIRDEIVKLARSSCSKFDGCAEIGEGFYVVDTKKYVIKRIEE